MEGIVSSPGALLFTMGMSAMLGALHAWLWSRRDPAHLWVAVWCFLALLYQAARLVQLVTPDPEVAVTAARAGIALGPLLVGSLVCFARALEGRPVGRLAALLGAAGVALGIVVLATDLVVTGRVQPKQDWFGDTHYGVPLSPLALVLVPVIAAGVLECLRAVARAPVPRSERRILVTSLLVYAGLGVLSVLSAMRWLDSGNVVEFGPIVVALGLTALLVQRHRRLQDRLQHMVDERTRRLVESEARYRELVENAPVGVFACDDRGEVLAMNRRLLEILGAPSEQEARRANAFTHPAMRESGAAESLRRCIQEEAVLASEHRYVSSWNQSSEVRLTAAPIRDESGRVTGALGIVEEVGDRRALERRLRQSQRLESVGQLAAGLAHEINNPIAYVRTNLTLLREQWQALQDAAAKTDAAGDPAPESEALIEESLEGVERIAGIVRDMRDFSRAADEHRAPCDLNAVVESAVRMATTWRRGETRITERYDRELPPAPGAEGQLRQVVLNLIVNAVQAVGQRGRVRIVTGRDAERAVIRVEDDGCGIPEEHLERLFDPFFTTKPAGEGTGLGLYVSYEIVRSHGGEIRVRSEPGRGTTFEVRLPLGEPERAASADGPGPPRAQ